MRPKKWHQNGLMRQTLDILLLSTNRTEKSGMKFIVALTVIFFQFFITGQTMDSINIKVLNVSAVNQWSRVEVGINLPNNLESAIENFVRKKGKDRLNPFLEWEIKVEATFLSPTGKKIIVDAFYFESFDAKMKNFMPPKNGLGYSDDEYLNLGE